MPGCDLKVGDYGDGEAWKDEGDDQLPLELWVDTEIEEDVCVEAGEHDGDAQVEEVEEEWLWFALTVILPPRALLEMVADCRHLVLSELPSVLVL